MATDLRPMSLGEILDRTAQMYRSNFPLFVGITIFPTAALFLFGVAQVLIARPIKARTVQLSSMGTFTIAGVVVGGLLYASLIGISLAATNRAVSDLNLGKPASIGSAYQQVRPNWFRYIWIMFVATVYAWGPAILIFGVVAGVVAMSAAMHLGTGVVAGAGVVALLGVLLVLPLGVWMTLRYSLSVPSSIVEGLGVHESLKRSVFLTKGRRWRVLVLALLVVAVSLVLGLAVQSPFLVLSYIAAKSHGTVSLLTQIGNQVGNFVVNALLGPVYGIAITLIYYDERIRKEGFDIEWMMQRANLAGEAPVVPSQGVPGPGGAVPEGPPLG